MSTQPMEHVEAFRLMRYGCKTCAHVETIWNSRDGVSPFIVGCQACGGEASHLPPWQADQFAPDYMPPLGSRIFVDLTEERARQKAKETAARYWETYPPSRDQFATVDDLAAMLTEAAIAEIGLGSPDLIVVAG